MTKGFVLVDRYTASCQLWGCALPEPMFCTEYFIFTGWPEMPEDGTSV
ncbi:MAG: hypothetical protein BWY67_01786 [Bacteroidetes bacterium ADurb.Bin397]|nr:MAG: hypothetical protein BWY67_01786 [Bacteroidetes bacterium ADurb.Bin397]